MARGFISSSVVAGLLTLTSTGAFAAKSPGDFLKDAIQGDNSEIMLGQIAQQKGGSQQVRDYGKTLVTDHSTAKDQASAVAKTIGVTPPDTPMAEAQDERTKLSTLSGDGFDREFGSYMVRDHENDIREFQDQAKANDGPVSALAAKQLPVLQKHLQMAQAIAAVAHQAGSASAVPGNALAQETADQWRASKLAGVRIYGPDDKNVGKITDVLMNKDGKAQYVIIGVGGFLGIGEKDVAIPFDQVVFTDEPLKAPPSTMGGTTATGGVAPAMTNSADSVATAAPGLGTPAAPIGTPGTASATGAGSDMSAGTGMARRTAYPDHGRISMTVDQLKGAPAFHFAP